MASLPQNRNYLVEIRKGGQGGDYVQANAQASIGVRIDNQWVNILEALGFSGDSGTFGNILNGFQLFSGNNFLPNIASSHVWRGSNGFDLGLALRFDAWDDPDKDVIQPIKKLISMYMPTRGDGSSSIFSSGGQSINVGSYFMHPPGPTPAEYIKGKAGDKTLSVQFGKLVKFENLIPLSLEWELLNRPDKNGRVVAANVNISLMSYTIPSADDAIKVFQL